MKAKLEAWLRARFVRMHGEGEENQADFYRCTTCGVLVTWHRIRRGRTCCAGHLVPTYPKWHEFARLMLVGS